MLQDIKDLEERCNQLSRAVNGHVPIQDVDRNGRNPDQDQGNSDHGDGDDGDSEDEDGEEDEEKKSRKRFPLKIRAR